ncbi:MAG: serine/threonine-protein kinase [Planctomycetaceae bacterium]
MKFTFAPEARPLDGYTIKRAIHRGGFGEVYYALSDAGKEVALKLLNNNLEVELRGVSQCLNLKHPNLVTIFDIRQDSDRDHWIVMEYVSGRGLYEALQDHPQGMPLPDVLHWLSGITSGLNFLHDRGIVHRDLKPANVFSDHGTVKIGDVGLSKYISESRRSAQTQSVGTVYYMAPEVARGRYGREVDVYALGVMLYEMLTGRVPFDGQTTAEILMKHLTAEPDLSPLPEKLRPVISAALNKDPDQRIGDVEELQRRFRIAAGTDAASSTAGAKAFVGAAIRDNSHERRFRAHGSPAAAVPTDNTDANPVWAAIRDNWNSLPAPAKWVVGGAVALLVLESGMIRPVAVGGLIGGIAYFGYRIVNYVVPARRKAPAVRKPQQEIPNPVTAVNATAYTAPPRRAPVETSHQSAPSQATRVYTPATIRRLTKQQRLADASSSLSVSLAAATLVTLAVFLTTGLLPQIQHAVYFGTVTMLAAWGLIVPAKMWEGRVGDSVTRRLVQGSIGAGVGFVAGVLSRYLMVHHDPLFLSHNGISKEMAVGRIVVTDGSGFPTVASFMIFFAALFVARRWWWQADSFRKSRFRVSSALFTLLIGAILTAVLPAFPETLGATWALAISAVVQLSAGWTPHEERSLNNPPAMSPERPSTKRSHRPELATTTPSPPVESAVYQ